MEKNKEDLLLSGLTQELRRGTIILSVLSQLKQPQYGYSLVQSLADKGLTMEAGTLYPLLRRLEKQGLLKSEWEADSAKPRKYYRLTDFGERMYAQLCEQWFEMVTNMDTFIKGER